MNIATQYFLRTHTLRCRCCFRLKLARRRSGSNLICTSIHLALSRILYGREALGDEAYIDELAIQVDNASSENKNSVLIGYLASLVGRKVVGRVEVNFMPVDHTHVLIDQCIRR